MTSQPVRHLLPALVLCAALLAGTTAHAAAAAPPAAASQPTSAEELLGLHPSPEPVRERPGWRPPHLILVQIRFGRAELLPAVQAAMPPGARLVEMSSATPREIAAADAAVGVCSAEVLAQATHLEWIQWLAAGVEECVKQPLLHAHHVLLTNTPAVAAPSIAEHVIAMMLALSRHFPDFIRQQQEHKWPHWDENPQLADIGGKTLLVVGLGNIGNEVARRAHALDMKVIAIRASGHEGPDYVSYVGLPDELLKLTQEADFVVNCLPLTPQTTGIFNAQFFAAMKPSAFFLSVGRGRSTVTADLVAALSAGKIAGAGLDVVDPEPLPPESPLWTLPNVILTPHASAHTPATQAQLVVLVRENLRRYAAGEPLFAVVDVERGY
jgi:phosphoglycerate dehydrogenase-like enzyme